ncbi:MAG TPA: HAMP domain-containing sensor histidine kinase [Thermoanaerobaculia bacterium]|jgi:signal transduction histidine kinase|nr:HAMP domain-containing sensor histidine kinase [Thermoanaerobaculia bacterium]
MRSRAPLLAGFALALAILLGALGWIAHTAFELERGQGEARALAAREERARLALWRMDSALSAFLAQENARPVGGALPGGDPRRPYDRLRFEIDAAGRLVTAGGSPSPEARALLGRDALLAALAQGPLAVEKPQRTKTTTEAPKTKEKKEDEPLAAEARQQMMLNTVEFSKRIEANQAASPPPLPLPRRERAPRVRTPLQPVWIGPELLLARRIERDGGEALEGIWLNREALRASLLGRVRDLLPTADLVPVRGGAADPGRQLALLPLRLDPGPPPALPGAGWTAARLGLVTASIAILLVAAGGGALLLGALRLARRRDDFVSAVTHELRTPLTTFRMYTEMLDEGMVPPGKTGEYLGTLRAEAERLGQLVENVFAFARLERGGPAARTEVVSLADLLQPIAGHLAADLERRGFDFSLHLPAEVETEPVRVDTVAVERILQNLADNAAKFARGASDRPRFEIRAEQTDRAVVLIASDDGPGIPRRERRRLFRPLRRSASRAAAEGAPGLGLGLALSRGLARSFGGDLRYLERLESGAAFALDLPRAAHQGSKQS